HRPTVAEEKAFLDRLGSCSSSRQVLHSSALWRSRLTLWQPCTAWLTQKDPSTGLVSALLACTYLYVDPWSRLAVRLVSECQERLDGSQMSVGQLCTFGQALLALEGPGCGMLEQVQRQEPGQWSLAELTATRALDGFYFPPRDSYQGDAVLLNLLHSYILVERFPVNFVSKVFNLYFLQKLQGTLIDKPTGRLTYLTQLHQLCQEEWGPRLLPMYRVKFFLTPGRSLEMPVDGHLYNYVKTGLVDLLGARAYFTSRVLTPYCYTLDVEIKLDEDGYVLPAHALCYFVVSLQDSHKRFTVNTRQLLGKEAMRLLGYEVVQISYYEFEKLRNKTEVVEHLHKNIFPLSYSWQYSAAVES
uniref:RAP domain-containing protein n=1 Tax=Oncorhynchus mykiss TaxID=8022 RepID=A0A8C7W870_ONCMY